jgi:hypothetical protein
VSKRSRISLWPGWDTLSAVSDAHRLVNTLASAHPHERPRSLVLVRVLAPALRADVHTLRLHNTTLRRDDSEVPRGQTREYLGPTPARGFPDWPRAPFSNPSIHRAIPRAPGTFGDRVSPRFQTAYVSGPPIGLQTGGAATTHLSGHHRLSPGGPTLSATETRAWGAPYSWMFADTAPSSRQSTPAGDNDTLYLVWHGSFKSPSIAHRILHLITPLLVWHRSFNSPRGHNKRSPRAA